MTILVLVPCPILTSKVTLHSKISESLENPTKGVVIDLRG